MTRWTTVFQNFYRDDSGATAIEYSMIAGFIALLIVGSIAKIGDTLSAIFDALLTGFS